MKTTVKQYVDELLDKYASPENAKELKEFKDKIYTELSESMENLSKVGEEWQLTFKKKIDALSDRFPAVAKTIELYKTQFKKEFADKDYSPHIFNDADLVGIKGAQKFNSCEMHNADLSQSAIPGSSFKFALAIGSKFINADVSACDFSYADLRNADFTGANLTSSIFKCTNMENTSLIDANLEHTSFLGVSFKSVLFNKAKFINTNFKYADLTDANLENSYLEGVNFTYAKLQGMNLKNAILKQVTFQTDVRDILFDGAQMDKLTYALLKNNGATLTNVTTLNN